MERITKDNKKGKKGIVLIIIMLIIIAIFVAFYVVNNVMVFDQNTSTNLVINNKNITSNLKKQILIQDDVIYLSKQDISNFFDKYIYEDTKVQKIITTNEDKVASIGFNSDTINVNGSDKKIKAHAINKNDTIYLPISEMTDVYNIEIENISNSKVVTIDSKDRELKRATLTGNSAVKSSTNFIAKTIDKVKKGEKVYLVSSDNSGWSKIRTVNGKIGYVKTSKLTDEVTIREKSEEKQKQIDGKVNLVWDYYSEVATAPDRTNTKIDGVNVVSPAFFHLNSEGTVQANIGESGQKYIEWAHKNGYKIWPMIQNAGDGMLKVTSGIMNDYNQRQNLIEQIIKMCKTYKIDGINIDFENMKKEDKDLYSRFIIELTPRMTELGLVTSVDVTAPDGGDTWSLCFDRHVIGDVADYIVFMAYDEFGSSSSEAGPTAGYNWVKLSLDKFLKTEEIDSNKIILGIPFFTRLWTIDSKGYVKSSVVAMKNINRALPTSNIERKWDEGAQQNYVEYLEGTNTKKMWIEDIDSLKTKIKLVNENNLAGIGSWAKGMENEDIWKAISEELSTK